MGRTKTYDSKKINIAFGSHVVTGYAEGTFLNIERSGDGVTKKTGADGEIVRSLDPDTSAKLTVTVTQLSPTVGWAQQQYDKDNDTGDGTFPVLVKDMKGGLIFAAEDGWVVNPPNREFGREAGEYEIEIDTGPATWEGEAI